jgi:hypothetical protein
VLRFGKHFMGISFQRFWYLTFLLLVSAKTASSLQFTLNYDPSINPLALAGFEQAAAFWSSYLVDPINVNLNVGFAPLAGNIIGQTSVTEGTANYTNTRFALTLDGKSDDDVTAVASLQLGPSFHMSINDTSDNPNGSGSSTVYEATGNTVLLTTAQAKAMGFLVNPSTSDASITFNSDLSFDFAHGAVGGTIDPGSYDFVGVATHEIGHSLGFFSSVDSVDVSPGFLASQYDPTVLDLFRYSTSPLGYGPGVFDLSAGSAGQYFSVDGGATSIAAFSTGANHGNGYQASHWSPFSGTGIMQPTASQGQLLSVTPTDLRAFDVIGWDLGAPEPATIAMCILGFTAILLRRVRPGRPLG